tara:strand:- start:2577 stop:3452 length:876 start_codon:yes stop_codon:yes gene_type:complete
VKKINIFCFGFGQVARNFLNKIFLEKINVHLSTSNTLGTCTKKINNTKFQSYKFQNNDFDPLILEQLKESDHILVSIPPINGEDIVIKNFSNVLKNSKIKWITYLSATSVYGDHKGNWVNELSQTKPTSFNGSERLKVEQEWLKLANKKKLPFQIFRLSGIYSDKYNAIQRLMSGTANIIKKNNHYFSRIHVDDIANILFKSLSIFKSNEIYNVSDDKPASSEEVMMYAVKILNIKAPKIILEDQIENEMLKNFYQDSKKVSNKKMKKFFNYKLKFPSYIEGLNHIQKNLI